MKKAGIITFNRASNYGAALQAYAMKFVCDGLGYETHVIDYNKGPDEGPHPLKRFKAVRNKKSAAFRLIRGSMSYLWDKKRWGAFRQFRSDYLSESGQCENAEQVSALGFDAYICGSDQIWNYNITGGRFDRVYFGDFPTDAVRVVYAASSHDTPFPVNMELVLNSELKKTSAAISIRESKLADYVGELTGTRYPTVLDPTLLAGKEAFEPLLINETEGIGKPYILIYQIDANPFSDISVKTLEKRFGCRAYTMTVPRLGSIRGRKGTSGPCEFLDLIKNAQFLVTNSFHGVAFSLLFHKQFFVYENGGVMTRIDDLLKTVGLTDRKVKMVSDIDRDLMIDYVGIDAILAERRAESLSFLKEALNGKTFGEVYQDSFSLSPLREREKKDCSGCGACAEICPTAAIQMKPDDEGFLYPQIDERLCVSCRKCDEFCAFLPGERMPKCGGPEAYAVKHLDLNTRKTSRSGGAFIAFSDVILEEGGVIYGSVMEKDGSVHHIRATTAAERDRMKDAKYVQSNLGDCFAHAARDLEEGKAVLFSGTPCQVSGLKSFLKYQGIDDKALVTCDLVCHGVPSPMVWKDYLDLIRKKYHANIEKACFRDKSLGWDTHCESFLLDNGKKIISRDYTDLFYNHIMFRPSCHNCRYANVNRVGDLTLADFWGIENNAPDMEDSYGVSLVFVNTAQGSTVFDKAKEQLEYVKCNTLNCMQPTLVKPSTASPVREEFWKSYHSCGLEQTMQRFVRPVSAIPRIKRTCKGMLYKMRLRPHP